MASLHGTTRFEVHLLGLYDAGAVVVAATTHRVAAHGLEVVAGEGLEDGVFALSPAGHHCLAPWPKK